MDYTGIKRRKFKGDSGLADSLEASEGNTGDRVRSFSHKAKRRGAVTAVINTFSLNVTRGLSHILRPF